MNSSASTEDQRKEDDDDDNSIARQPIKMSPEDIRNIADEVKSLMLPEIKSMVKDQIPDIKGLLADAVNSIKGVVEKEVSSLRQDTESLHFKVTALEKHLTPKVRETKHLEKLTQEMPDTEGDISETDSDTFESRNAHFNFSEEQIPGKNLVLPISLETSDSGSTANTVMNLTHSQGELEQLPMIFSDGSCDQDKTDQRSKTDAARKKTYPLKKNMSYPFIIKDKTVEGYQQKRDVRNTATSELIGGGDRDVSLAGHSNCTVDLFRDPAEKSELKGSLATVFPQQQFPSTMIMSAGQVTSYENCTVIQQEHQSYDKNDGYKNQMDMILNTYKQKDELFVETQAYAELQNILGFNHWGLIVGKPGDGKTAMAKHMLLKYRYKGYEVIILHSTKDWKQYVGSSTSKQCVFIDDMFGEMNLEENKASDWLSLAQFMQDVVKSRDGNLIVICTSRKMIYSDIKPKLVKYSCFNDSNVVDLSSECFALSTDEKLEMWNRYTKTHGVSSEMPPCIFDRKPLPHGFPHCVELFCTNRLLQNKGVAFFNNPMKYICAEITNFMQNDRRRYFAMLLILNHDNKLYEEDIDQILEKERDVYEPIVGNLFTPTRTELSVGLKCMYVSEPVAGQYSISHDSIRENLAKLYIKDSPHHALKFIDFRYLVSHARLNCTVSKNQADEVILPDYCTDLLIQRMTKEIKSGNVINVCEHPAWKSDEFVKKFKMHLNRVGDGTKPTESTINDICTIRDSTNPYVRRWNLMETLDIFEHKTAVDQLRRLMSVKISKDTDVVYLGCHSSRDLSNILSKALANIGVSTRIRCALTNSLTRMEISDNIWARIRTENASDVYMSIYGSRREGIAYAGLECDSDQVIALENPRVVETLKEAAKGQTCVLLIKDEATKPAYAKFQLVENQEPQFYFSDKPLDELHKNLPPFTVTVDHKNRKVIQMDFDDRNWCCRHGPAMTLQPPNAHIDLVLALKCSFWLTEAVSYFTRPRPYGWPTSYVLEKMKTQGCLYIPSGHLRSSETHREWRCSFSSQETLLVDTFTPPQFQCYVLLQMTRKGVINALAGERALCSYHMKTCMFHLIENTPPNFWRSENLYKCLNACLQCLLDWTEKGYCPSYFIPKDNLFEHYIHGEIQSKLLTTLQSLLKDGGQYLLQVKEGELGKCLEQTLKQTDRPENSVEIDRIEEELYYMNMMYEQNMRNTILCKICSDNSTADLRSTQNEILSQLKDTSKIWFYSEAETKEALSRIVPYVELSLKTVFIASSLQSQGVSQTLKFLKEQGVTNYSDMFSLGLKLGAVLHTHGHIQDSACILAELKNPCSSDVVSVCSCRPGIKSTTNGKGSDDKTSGDRSTNEVSEATVKRNECITCVVFMDAEKEVVPAAIACEMKRSRDANIWFEWAVVDGKILYQFLMFLIHQGLGMNVHAASDIQTMEMVINTDIHLGHRETDLSLLRWMKNRQGSEMLRSVVGTRAAIGHRQACNVN